MNFRLGLRDHMYNIHLLGSLFAAIAAVETLCTLLGAVIFNCLYSFTTQLGLRQLIFIAMALLLVTPLTILQ